MPNLLALDTSTQACSAALWLEGKVYELFELKPQQHTQIILPMLTQLLAEAGIGLQQIDALSYACGPGSFTGLRIGAGIIQGIALAHDLPVIPISTLQTLAQTTYRTKGWQSVLTALDARMNEVYWAGFILSQGQAMQAILPEQICRPQQAPLFGEGLWYGVGDGWHIYKAELEQQFGDKLLEAAPHVYPQAQDVAWLASLAYRQNKMVAADEALPMYLRNDMYKPHG